MQEAKGPEKCDLKNEVAVVTGGAEVLAERPALLFAQEGAKLVLNDLEAELVQQTAELITNQGQEVTD